MTLDAIARGNNARIISVDWTSIANEDGMRLRALGLDEGASVAIAHRGIFGGRDPVAVTIGRMTVAMRRSHAAAMTVEQI